MTTQGTMTPNRHDRRHPDELPEWITKTQLSNYLQISLRQCEILVKAGRLPKPLRLLSHPRWKKSELIAFLDGLAAADAAEQGGTEQ